MTETLTNLMNNTAQNRSSEHQDLVEFRYFVGDANRDWLTTIEGLATDRTIDRRAALVAELSRLTRRLTIDPGHHTASLPDEVGAPTLHLIEPAETASRRVRRG